MDFILMENIRGTDEMFNSKDRKVVIPQILAVKMKTLELQERLTGKVRNESSNFV